MIHSDLMKAIVLPAIVKLPDNAQRQLFFSIPTKAEEVLATSIVVALAQRK